MSLEFLRRVQREYDGYLQRQDRKAYVPTATDSHSSVPSSELEADTGKIASSNTHTVPTPILYKPHIKRVTLIQRQIIRSLLHTLQFGVAYFVMLLAMYYNGLWYPVKKIRS